MVQAGTSRMRRLGFAVLGALLALVFALSVAAGGMGTATAAEHPPFCDGLEIAIANSDQGGGSELLGEAYDTYCVR